MFIKKAGPLVAGAAIAIATVTAVAPTAGAAERVSAERQVTFTCLGTGSELSTVSPNAFEVTYPEEVAPGEIFTVSVCNRGAMRNNARAVNRMTFDYALPTNATHLGPEPGRKCDWSLRCGALGGTSQSAGQDHQCHRYGGTDLGRRVGALRHQHLHYRHRRNLCCGEHPIFGCPSSMSSYEPPAQVGAAVTIGLPGANEAHTGTTGTAASTDLQYLRVSPSNPVQCSSGAEASALTTTTVGNLAPALLPSHHHPRGWTAHPGPEPADTVHCQSYRRVRYRRSSPGQGRLS